MTKQNNWSNEKLPRDRDVTAGDEKKLQSNITKLQNFTKQKRQMLRPRKMLFLRKKDKEESKADVYAEDMKNVEPNTTKDAFETSKVDGEATIVIEYCKKINQKSNQSQCYYVTCLVLLLFIVMSLHRLLQNRLLPFQNLIYRFKRMPQ